MNPSLQELLKNTNGIVEKICFDPEVRLNAKLAIEGELRRAYELGVDDGSMKQMILDGKTIKEQIEHAVEAERARILKGLPEERDINADSGAYGFNQCRQQVLALLEGEKST